MGGVQDPKPWPDTRCRGQSAYALGRSKVHSAWLQGRSNTARQQDAQRLVLPASWTFQLLSACA